MLTTPDKASKESLLAGRQATGKAPGPPAVCHQPSPTSAHHCSNPPSPWQSTVHYIHQHIQPPSSLPSGICYLPILPFFLLES